jgi:hypothetical protein
MSSAFEVETIEATLQWRCDGYHIAAQQKHFAPVAQLDRATDF